MPVKVIGCFRTPTQLRWSTQLHGGNGSYTCSRWFCSRCLPALGCSAGDWEGERVLRLPGLCCLVLPAARVIPTVPQILCASTALWKLAQGPRKLRVILQLGGVFFLLSAFFLNSGIKKLLGWEGGRFYSPAFLAVISSRTQISLFQRGNKGQRSSRMDFQMASSSFLGAWLHLWITYTGR